MTVIRDDEQVEYRLREQAGCSVVAADDVVQEVADPALEYRLREETYSPLVWMGSGLAAVGLTAGAVLDEEGKQAARQLMSGCHPETGARLIRTQTSARAHPAAKLTTARLVEAIEAAAEEKGVTGVELLEGKPKQQKVLAQQHRMVHRFGDRHRMQMTTLHRLARAAGLSLDDVYGERELAEAREHADQRVDDRVRGWDLMLDVPKSDSVLPGLMGEADEREYRDMVHRATPETIREVERWVGYAVGSEDGRPVRLAAGGLLAWSVEHQSARPMGDGTPGDPHLHLHVTIANMGLCEDGEWRSIGNSGQDLHRHAAADAFFKARVRALTHARFGVRRQQAERTGAWEVDGIPEPVRDLFSRRHGLIVDLAGDEAGRQERDRAAAETLRAKHRGDASAMRESWRHCAEEAGVDVDAMVAAAAPGPPGPDSGPTVDGPGGRRIPPPPSDLAQIVFHPTESADEACSQILTTWDELRRDRWPDTHDLLDELVVLAARNADVDALNLGPQQIRRAAGELGDERTYALSGGYRLTLAEGDAVPVRANDHRSRLGEGPDLLNGYRAVVSQLAEDGRVEITWRTRERGQDDA